MKAFKIVVLAVLATLAFWSGGCGTSWQADDVTYVGKPGLLIEAFGNRIYIGGAGELHAKGSASSPNPEDAP